MIDGKFVFRAVAYSMNMPNILCRGPTFLVCGTRRVRHVSRRGRNYDIVFKAYMVLSCVLILMDLFYSTHHFGLNCTNLQFPIIHD